MGRGDCVMRLSRQFRRRGYDAAMPSVDAIVTALIPEFELAYARDAEGCQYAITPDTTGTRWRELHEGQRVRLLQERGVC